MSTRLTREEFIARFDERRDFFVMAMNHDLTLFKSKIRTEIKINPENPKKPEVNLEVNEFANELVGKSVSRLIDLVYQDMD